LDKQGCESNNLLVTRIWLTLSPPSAAEVV
jgi:hypothetical protein